MFNDHTALGVTSRTSYITRRGLLVASLMGLSSPASANSSDDDWQQVLAQSIATNSPLTLGRIVPPPDDPSWREVDGLLARAPASIPGKRVTPYEVASYLATTVPDKFRMAWPESNPAHPTYANPLILRLFLSTKTVPMGDETAWCAAFVNWCLKRARIKGTASASSQSFSNSGWGTRVWRQGEESLPSRAATGDIAVFRLRYDTSHGHVCFFKQISKTQPNSIEVLGGNQIRGHGAARRHLIGTDTFRVDGDLALWEIRTASGLRA